MFVVYFDFGVSYYGVGLFFMFTFRVFLLVIGCLGIFFGESFFEYLEVVRIKDVYIGFLG